MRAQKAADGFSALGNISRLHIFRFLLQAGPDGAAIGRIQQHLAMPLSTLAHHLNMLVKAELVVQQKMGRQVICRANFARKDQLIDFLTENCCMGLPELDAETETKEHSEAVSQ